MIFSITGNHLNAKKIEEGSFEELNIWERNNIQEWIRKNPEILGEELLTLSIEFDRFKNSNDRLDILALDRKGNLVVVELKRDISAGYADLQSIRYAAMVSSMTIDLIIPYYKDYKQKYDDEHLTNEEARNLIMEFVESDDFSELSSKPRIILGSQGFSQELTATVLWLRDSDIDISCVEVAPYSINGQIIIVPKVIIPLAEAQQYLIEIKKKEEQEKSKTQTRPKTKRILLDNKLIHEGQSISLRNGLPKYVQYDEKNEIFQATLTTNYGNGKGVIWAKDGKEYSISTLTWQIFKDMHPENKDPGGINGNIHWVTDDGTCLFDVADDFYNKKLKEAA